MNSPERKEMQEAVKSSKPLKRSNSNDKLDGQPNESIEEAMARKEEEERIAELKQQRLTRYEAIGNFIGFINSQIWNQLNIENQKKLLSFNSNFDSMEIFRALDKDNNGYLTENEFNEYFKDDFEEGALDPTVWATVINALNNSRDEGKLNYNDFQKGISPAGGNNRYGAQSGYGGGYGGNYGGRYGGGYGYGGG